jgi:hypothetical protein
VRRDWKQLTLYIRMYYLKLLQTVIPTFPDVFYVIHFKRYIVFCRILLITFYFFRYSAMNMFPTTTSQSPVNSGISGQSAKGLPAWRRRPNRIDRPLDWILCLELISGVITCVA